MRIFGIDPGSRVLGYGWVDEAGSRLTVGGYGVVKPPDRNFAARLAHVHTELTRLIEEAAPDAVAIEEVFQGKNVKVLVKMGETRGVAILAATLAGLPVYGYSPSEIKKAATGSGNADKERVSRMVTQLLHLESPPEEHDAADALATAICHIRRIPLLKLNPPADA